MKRSLSARSSEDSFTTAEDDVGSALRREPSTLARGVSPPPVTRSSGSRTQGQYAQRHESSKVEPTTAEVEAGSVDVVDHVEFFSTKLAQSTLPLSSSPRLQHSEWLASYKKASMSSSGHHFVIHQHDHPIAGTHYDLRLQINATSSISFAIMYGLPGDPNSRRLNRNATETRVHCLWNHLIETASPQTGTMLIWDTGEYEVMEKAALEKEADSDTESDSENHTSFQSSFSDLSQPEKLASAFSHRKIRLRLHGTRLPRGYTVYLRLTKDNDRSAQPKAPAFKRQRKSRTTEHVNRSRKDSTTSASSQSSSSRATRSPSADEQASDSSGNTQFTRNSTHRRVRHTVSSLKRTASPPRRLASEQSSLRDLKAGTQPPSPNTKAGPLSARSADLEANTHAPGDEFVAASNAQDEQESIRQQNAYPGAHNSVNSIHQRKWYLSLDRTLSGFHPIPTPHDIKHHTKTYWVPIVEPASSGPPSPNPNIQDLSTEQQTRLKQSRNAPGFRRFHVLGREHERSVVTGRLAAQILSDEGVEGYVPRGRWRAVVE